MIGINDLLRGATVADTVEHYRTILDALQKAVIKVYIQATIECARSQCGAVVEKVRALSEILKLTAQKRGLVWIDINPVLTTNEQGLLAQYSSDGLHLTMPAYLYWAKQIKSHIN